MSQKLFLVKLGEIALKKGNRKEFERRLLHNILKPLSETDARCRIVHGRCYLEVGAEYTDSVHYVLARTFGVVGFCVTQKCIKSLPAIEEGILAEFVRHPHPEEIKTFRISARRIDKKFPHSSQELQEHLGRVVLNAHPHLKVNLTNPDVCLSVEVRENAYVYSVEEKGVGGLPLGSAGKGLLLLSGGIDSPVAGLMMASRGLNIRAIHFHTQPFTSEEAIQKVRELAQLMSSYTHEIELISVQFLPLQKLINKMVSSEAVTLHSRAMMLQIASKVAAKNGDDCLITGESLSQVASQTIGNLRFTNNYHDDLVVRPLIGIDKEMIINFARKFGTFEKSIEPHTDCCVLFAPKHPILRPKIHQEKQVFSKLEGDDLIEEAIKNAVIYRITRNEIIVINEEI